MINWLRGAWSYWRGQWELAYLMADYAFTAYMERVQQELESRGLAKPVTEQKPRSITSRIIRLCLLLLLFYLIIDWVF